MKKILFALAIASCGPTMSPKEAHEIEMRQCESRSKDAEAVRRCQALVRHKYARYFAEGEVSELGWPR